MKKLLYLSVLGAIVFGVSFWALSDIYKSSHAADNSVELNQNNVTAGSSAITKRNRKVFSLQGGAGKLYTSKQPGASGVYEFLNKNIHINKRAKNDVSNDQEVSIVGLTKGLKPKRVISDTEDPILKKAGKAGNRSHYFFQQQINGLPVYGTSSTVHIKNDNEVYAFTGNLISDSSLEAETITANSAEQIAIKSVSKDADSKVSIATNEKEAVNPQVAGLSDDDKTYPSLVMTVVEKKGQITNPTRVIVSLTDGKILETTSLREDALNRMVYDCQQNTNCTLKRNETMPTSGVADADGMFGFLGDIYSFYSGKMSRDSYDNQGGTYRAFVNVPDVIGGKQYCPNASWLPATGGAQNEIDVCPGWVKKDIIAHEVTHGVVEYTAGLDNKNESGAMNEATADVFATGVDDDWAIGEDLSIGALRHLDDPSQDIQLNSSGQVTVYALPDRMFSSRFYCGTQDNGGVHLNMTVPTKAFYLMSAGGSFNGCTMVGVGKDKALLVWYQALTKYLNVSSNFKDLYNSLNQGCTDLYGANSTECVNIKIALQSTELDQQPTGDQSGPKCTGVAAQPASCVGSTAVPPSITLAPPTATTVPQASNTPGPVCTNHVEGDANNDGKVSLTDFETWRRAYTGQ